MPHRATWESTRVRQEAESKGRCEREIYCHFHRKGQVRQGKRAQGCPELNIFSGLWEVEAVSYCLLQSVGD